MLKKIAKKRLFCLFPILIILFVTIGLPLVHPLLHRPSGADYHLTHNGAHHSFVAIELPLVHPLLRHPSDDDHHLMHNCAHHHGGAHDDDQASECPVCHFLLTNQCLIGEFTYGIPTKIDLEPLAHVYFLSERDRDLKQINPRAPPEVTFLTI